MRKNIISILIALCALPSYISPKNITSTKPEATPQDNQKAPAIPEAKAKGSSLFKRNKERRQTRKTISNKSYEELRNKQQEYIKSGDAYLALKYTEKMYNQCEDIEELCILMLTLGDLCFQQKNYKKASALFAEFIRAYPGSEHVEHASYYAILCSFEQQTTTADRDQTTTKETILLADAFLKRAERFKTYTAQVQDILNRCQQRLLDHEMGIFDFYVHKGSLNAANKRLARIRQEFVPRLASAELQILLQECRLAYAQDNPELAERKALEVATKYPHQLHDDRVKAVPELADVLKTASVVVAQKQSAHSSFVDRF